MAKIQLDITKSIDENASIYFEKAKKERKKIEGAKDALREQVLELKKLEKKIEKEQNQPKIVKKKKEWYEKFRWFYSSDGFLCIGGRDATTNEILIKKHMDKNDLVFHTDMAGSPFFVIKNPDKREIPQTTINEVAQATASFSKAWKLGMSYLDVFYVNPNQVTKEAKSGEYLPKGSFMVYGKTNYLKPNLELAISNTSYGIMCAPYDSVKAHIIKGSKIFIIKIGRNKPSDIAKKLAKVLNYNDLDGFIRILPSGNMELLKVR